MSVEDLDVVLEDQVPDTVLDDTAREAAEQLLRGTLTKGPNNGDINGSGAEENGNEVPRIQLTFGNDTFLLFDCDDEDEERPNDSHFLEENSGTDMDEDKEDDVSAERSTQEYPVMITDSVVLFKTCTESMKTIREFLNTFYGSLKFISSEILLEFDSLKLTLCEDNIHNTYVTFRDIGMIFDILRKKSIENNENDVPKFLSGRIKLRERFVTRYNTLVELTQSSATLQNVVPFSNDQDHPVLLEEGNETPIQNSEVIFMNLEDEEDANAEKEVDMNNV